MTSCPYCEMTTGGQHDPSCVLSEDRIKTRGLPVVQGPVGWICPVCGRGNSPYALSCPCGPNKAQKVTFATDAGNAGETDMSLLDGSKSP